MMSCWLQDDGPYQGSCKVLTAHPVVMPHSLLSVQYHGEHLSGIRGAEYLRLVGGWGEIHSCCSPLRIPLRIPLATQPFTFVKIWPALGILAKLQFQVPAFAWGSGRKFLVKEDGWCIGVCDDMIFDRG